MTDSKVEVSVNSGDVMVFKVTGELALQLKDMFCAMRACKKILFGDRALEKDDGSLLCEILFAGLSRLAAVYVMLPFPKKVIRASDLLEPVPVGSSPKNSHTTDSGESGAL